MHNPEKTPPEENADHNDKDAKRYAGQTRREWLKRSSAAFAIAVLGFVGYTLDSIRRLRNEVEELQNVLSRTDTGLNPERAQQYRKVATSITGLSNRLIVVAESQADAAQTERELQSIEQEIHATRSMLPQQEDVGIAAQYDKRVHSQLTAHLNTLELSVQQMRNDATQ